LTWKYNVRAILVSETHRFSIANFVMSSCVFLKNPRFTTRHCFSQEVGYLPKYCSNIWTVSNIS